MPGPYLDIYGLTRHRNLATITHFLDTYIDRRAYEDLGEGELLMVRLDAPPDAADSERYESEPARTLSAAIRRGLDDPPRSFTLYFWSKQPDIGPVLLGFTTDDQLVLGVSILDVEALPENEERAKQLLDSLLEEFDCHLGLIMVETPPPENEAAFRKQGTDPGTVYFQDLAR